VVDIAKISIIDRKKEYHSRMKAFQAGQTWIQIPVYKD
jgi:hypothetical protein